MNRDEDSPVHARVVATAGGATAVAMATLVAATAILPPFLVTALYPLISADVAVSRTEVALLVSVFFVVSALIAPLAGGLVARQGTARTLTVSGSTTTVALASIALSGWHPSLLLGFAIAGGVGNGLAQPTTNQVIVDNIRRRRGLGLAIKQAAFPAATFLAGAAVPLAAQALTWASTIGLLAAIAAALTVLGARAARARAVPVPVVRRERGPDRTNAALAGVAAFLAVVAAGSLASLLVDWAVETGYSASLAGAALAVASLASAATRLAMGRWADTHESHLLATALLMATAPVGYAVLVLFDSSAGLFLGPLFALSVGWGWDGVLLHGVIRRSATSAATSTGIVITGLAMGTGVGPAMTSAIAGPGGDRYAVAWIVNGTVAATAAILMLAVHRRWDAARCDRTASV